MPQEYAAVQLKGRCAIPCGWYHISDKKVVIEMMIFSIFYRQGDFESETGHCTLIFREGFEFNLISMFENFVLKICLAQIWMQTKGC